MPNLNVPFGGTTLIEPGAYYVDSVSAALPTTPPVTPPLIFLGYGFGPQPFTIQQFSSTQNLQTALRGGPAASYIQFLSTPSPSLNGAQIITFIDCSNNTQSSLTVSGTTSGQVVGQFKSGLYGLPSNLLQLTIATSSLYAAYSGQANAQSSRKITIYDGYSGATYSQDNLGAPLSVTYTGSAPSSAVAASTIAVTSAAFTVSVNGYPAQSFSIPIASGGYNTVSLVAEYLNGTGYYNAVVNTFGSMPATSLDLQSVPLQSSGIPTIVGAVLAGPAYWANTQTNGLISFTPAVLSSPSNQLATLVGSNFSGATNVTPVASGYASGFNLALATPGWAVITDSPASGVQTLGAQHCVQASAPNVNTWRRFVGGNSVGELVSTAITTAQAMDAYEAAYAHPGIVRNDPFTGNPVTWGGIGVAAAAAAIMAGNPANTPLTHKPLTGIGAEQVLTITNIDQLQQGGVMPVATVNQSGVPYIISDFTTWQVDSNPENVFNQQVAERFYLAYSMINTLEPYTGTVASTYNETVILNAAKATLNALVNSQGNPTGILNSWDSSTLALVYNGSNQVAAITVNVVLVGQNRFITCTVNVQPLNITIQATAS